MALLRAAIRNAFERAGYWFAPRQVLPFGIDYLLDIQRLAAMHGLTITTAFDVGAHIGQTAKDFLNAFPAAQVYSFEPHPHAFHFLEAMTSPRLHAQNIALSNSRRTADFYVHSEPTQAAGIPSTGNSLVAGRRRGLGDRPGEYGAKIEVQCRTVDDFCEEIGIPRVDLLKIDVERHEVEVLQGAQKTLGSASFVFLEFETVLPINGVVGGALAPAAEILQPAGFRFVASYPVLMTARPLYTVFNALYFRAPN